MGKDRHNIVGPKVFAMSDLFSAIRHTEGVLLHIGSELAKLKLTKEEKEWIRLTQGNHAKRILKLISSQIHQRP